MMKVAFALIVAFILCAPFAICSERPDAQAGRDTIDRAVAKTNILALTTFEMKATVHIHEKGKDLTGTYSLLWNGPGRWREEIHLPGYDETSVGGKGTVSVARSAEHGPEQSYYLRSALGLGPMGTSLTRGVRADEKVKRVREHKVNGGKATCVELVDLRKNEREICVDDASGLIVRQDPLTDGDFVPVDSKMYPRTIRRKGDRDSGNSLEVRIQEINSKAEIPSAQFEPPPGSSARPGCLNPDPPRLAKKVAPSYPQAERASRIGGRTVFMTWIGADGIPKDPFLLTATTSGFAQASWDGIRQWHYDPATCDGVPVDERVLAETNYTLSY